MNELRQGDELVADYLARVRAAAAALDPGRRDELIEDLREHIAAARAELSPETEAGVRTVLDRLGDPAMIVAEACATESPAQQPVAAPVTVQPPGPRSNRALMAVLITVLALFLLGPLILCVGGIAFLMPWTTEGGPGPAPIVSEETIPAPTRTPQPS